jgi:hypothetical protein
MQCRPLPRRGSGGSMYTRKAQATREAPVRGRAHDQPTTREGWVGRSGVTEGLVLPWKSGNADGGKEPWFKAHAGSNKGAEIGATLQNSGSFRRCEVHAMWKRRENSNVAFVRGTRRPVTGGLGGCEQSHASGSRVRALGCFTIGIGKRDLPWAKACCLVREPDAGDPHVRFDERRLETEPWRG